MKAWQVKRPRPQRGPRNKKEPAPSSLEAEKELHAWMMNKCLEMITKIGKVRGATWFTSRVDPIRMFHPDYNETVKKPMDLGTVRRNLRRGLYDKTPTMFAADVKLIFDNALLYSPKGNKVHDFARKLLAKFENLYFQFYQEYDQRRRGLMGDDEKNAVRERMKEWLVVRRVKAEVVSILKEHNPDMILNEEPLVLDWGLLDRETLMEFENAISQK